MSRRKSGNGRNIFIYLTQITQITQIYYLSPAEIFMSRRNSRKSRNFYCHTELLEQREQSQMHLSYVES